MKMLKGFRTDVAKIEGVTSEGKPPSYWTTSGNYVLNRILGGSFKKAAGQGRMVGLVGPSGSGKSYLLCNFIKQAQQEQDAFVLALDSENALDDDFVGKIGVDTSPDNYMYLSVITIPHVKKIISTFIKGYQDTNETRPVFIAIDSLGMLLTDTEFDLLEKGDNKGDQGQRAKQLKSILRGFVQQIKGLNIQIFVTDQVYAANQDAKLNGTADGNWVVNGAVKYSLSNILMITKMKLREGTAAESGEVIGVKMKCEAIKTRFTKPFQKVVIEVPYETGMDPQSGLKEVAIEMGILRKKGAYVVIEKTQDQFWWKDLNDERIQVILGEAELMTNISIGKSVEEEEEIIEGTEGSLKQKRLANYAKFKEQNPDYVPEGSGEDL